MKQNGKLNRVMEAENISKNGASMKSIMSRGIILFLVFFAPINSLQAQQLEAFKSIYSAWDSGAFTPPETLDGLKVMADEIEKCAPINHAKMHKILMSSKFEEILIYTSSNIHKYDKNTRSEAYKASVATGNSKVIAAANASLDKVNWEGVDRNLKGNSSNSSSSLNDKLKEGGFFNKSVFAFTGTYSDALALSKSNVDITIDVMNKTIVFPKLTDRTFKMTEFSTPFEGIWWVKGEDNEGNKLLFGNMKNGWVQDTLSGTLTTNKFKIPFNVYDIKGDNICQLIKKALDSYETKSNTTTTPKPQPQTASTAPSTEYVIINGVKWATRNVGSRGSFVAQPHLAGQHYTWSEAQNACPSGWRLPTKNEMESLSQAPSKLIATNGVTAGMEFGSAPNIIFLPAASSSSNGSYQEHFRGGGLYWSSTIYGSESAYCLLFALGDKSVVHNSRRAGSYPLGYSVRCVK